MKPNLLHFVLAVTSAAALQAHEWHSHDTEPVHRHPHPPSSPPIVSAPNSSFLTAQQGKTSSLPSSPAAARHFQAFPRLDVRWDQRFLYVGSNGLPDHSMMVGITAWQQQVPLPQAYFGDNAWRIPLQPVPARQPAMIKGRFLRGAIALAVNGIPIFNPQNNRGELSYEIGELDQWGGHCGRADDYHYHIAPLHLESITGKGQPIAYALDGYPIYGLTEPDGSPVGKMDECNGHETAAWGYHYHASMQYPYVLGGFHGEVTELDGQVDPQPRAQGVREALTALRGAKISGFEGTGKDSYKLSYDLNGDKRSIAYSIEANGTYPFRFDNGRDGIVEEVYTLRRQGGGGGPWRGRGQGGQPGSPGGKETGRGGKGGKDTFVPRADQPRSSDGRFLLSSPVMEDLTEMPLEYTGEGEATTPPLTWNGVPSGTRSYALIMDHADKEGNMKWYWTLYDIPAGTTELPKNAQGIGKMGTGFKGKTGYEPPMSKGPGAHTYVITLYALSGPLEVAGTPGREELLAAMQGKVIASSSLRVIHASAGAAGPRQEARPMEGKQASAPDRPNRPGGGKGGPPGLIKPGIDDTMKLNVYADNWFMLYVNGRLVAVDSIQFTPHNVVSVDFLPEYPMTIAVLAKDNADPKTGLEYGTSIGDGGFILKFADGTVTNANWKAKSYFHGPVNSDIANPQVRLEPLPANWWEIDFDDSKWQNAQEYTVEEVDPRQPYFEHDFEGAKFIWTGDLALDNTVIFRTTIEKSGWTPRWNTKPNLDVTGAPLR